MSLGTMQNSASKSTGTGKRLNVIQSSEDRCSTNAQLHCQRCRAVLMSRMGWITILIVGALAAIAAQPFYGVDLSFAVEVACNTILSVAVVSGLVTLHKHVDKFQDFRFSDVVDGRIDALVYVLVSFSTAICLFELCIRIVWSVTIGWESIPETWKIVLLLVRIGMGTVSTATHLLIAKVLSSELWDQCKRL